MTQEEQNAAELVAALGEHQVTDDAGQVAAPDAAEEINTPETKPTVTEPAQVEKPAVKDEVAPKATEAEDQNELAEDETGKRYIPKERFDQVYGKLKDAERKLASTPAPAMQPPQPQPQSSQPLDRTTSLEIEVLKGKLPQFDPESDQYDKVLDTAAGEFYEAGKAKGLTIMEAAKKAINFQRDLSEKITATKAEARTVKAIQSDPGITNRVVNRNSAKANPDDMSLEEMEAYLKANRDW